MNCWQWCKTVLVLAAVLGVLIPAPCWAETQAVSPPAASGQQYAEDVRLDNTGVLHGMVVDPQAKPVSGAIVALRASGQKPVIARTDSKGRFAVAGLRGGVYQLATGGGRKLLRVWSAQAAPPAAKPQAVVVAGQVVRGQLPLESFFASDAFIITGMVAAMIAIPVVVATSDDTDVPASP